MIRKSKHDQRKQIRIKTEHNQFFYILETRWQRRLSADPENRSAEFETSHFIGMGLSSRAEIQASSHVK